MIDIEDNGAGLSTNKTTTDGHTSMGHKITDKRIELYNKSYPDHISWHIEPIADVHGNPKGTRVRLAIRIEPITERQNDAYKPIQSLITEIT